MGKIFLIIAMCTVCAYADPTKPPACKESWLKDQCDQTDTFEIPLGTSEEESESELEALEEKPSKKPPVHNH